jgi:hypothetical protein
MNERIQALADQAGKYADETQPRGSYTRDGMWLYAYNEKFAELIVRECADIAYQFSTENKRIHPDIDPKNMPEANQSVYHCTCQAVGHEIREHFGVEL